MMIDGGSNRVSRLDKAILRFEAQRLLLNSACAEIAERHRPGDGLIVELGLGNGRTFDHLRERLPGFRIVVFEREPTANPSTSPSADNLVVGEIVLQVPRFCAANPERALLVHADLGNGLDDYDRELEGWLPAAALALCRPGAILITSTRCDHRHLVDETPPAEIVRYEYYRYRALAGAA